MSFANFTNIFFCKVPNAVRYTWNSKHSCKMIFGFRCREILFKKQKTKTWLCPSLPTSNLLFGKVGPQPQSSLEVILFYLKVLGALNITLNNDSQPLSVSLNIIMRHPLPVSIYYYVWSFRPISLSPQPFPRHKRPFIKNVSAVKSVE